MKKQTRDDGRPFSRARAVFLLCICLFLNVGLLSAQTSRINISGIVKDPSGEPVIGATVLEKSNPSNGTITDLDGNFMLSVAADAALEVSYIGYTTETVPVSGKTFLNILLKEDSKQLDEVVVVGFGVQKKVNLTGSVGIVDTKVLESRPVTRAIDALQGAVPGLQISSKDTGQMDTGKSISIRGTGTIGDGSSGDPLILIDGVEGDLTMINPQDIESISVLKDAASSSIYGSRAPFGVILVTTKRGKSGKAQVNYNNSFRFISPINMPKMMNAWEYVNYMDDGFKNAGGSDRFYYFTETPAGYTQTFAELVRDYVNGNYINGNPLNAMVEDPSGNNKWYYDRSFGNVDWLKEYYKSSSFAHEHNASVSGGTEKVSYYFSANYLGQDGQLRYGTENYQRYALTGNFDAELSKYVKIGFNSRFTRMDYDKPTMLTDDFYTHVMRRARPTRPVVDPNGYNASDINYVEAFANGGRTIKQNDVYTNQFKITITPLKNWNIIGEMNIRIDSDWTHTETFVANAYYVDGVTPYAATNTGPSEDGEAIREYSQRATFLNPNIYTNYSFSLNDKHNFTAMLGFQAEKYDKRNVDAERLLVVSHDLPVLNLTTGEVSVLTGEYQNWRTAGFFGRLNYDYEGKYLAEVNARYDGSSRFQKDQRWIWTPSFSLGWNVAREEFFESIAEYIPLLKFRGSYGVLANQNTTGWYPTYTIMEVKPNDGNWILNDSKQTIASAPKLVSSSLTWEKIKTTNIGFDFGVLNNRLTGAFDYFIRKTNNMVGEGIELPVILGTDVPKTNNTDLKTYGWELQLGWRDRVRDFSYGVTFSLADAQSKLLRYQRTTNTFDTYNGPKFEGRKLGEIWGYTTIGIAKTDAEMEAHLSSSSQSKLGSNWAAGDIMYADLNKDGEVSNGSNTLEDHGDLKVIGNNTPRFHTGITIDLAYKGFDLQMFWQGILKRDWYPTGMQFWGLTSSGEWWSTALEKHLDYFRNDADHALGMNLDSYYPRPVFSDKNQQYQTKYLQNAAYMRLKNLQLGYTFPQPVVSKIGLQHLRVFVSGENLLTITKLRGVLDPESVGIGKEGGATYPMTRTYSVGLSVNF